MGMLTFLEFVAWSLSVRWFKPFDWDLVPLSRRKKYPTFAFRKVFGTESPSTPTGVGTGGGAVGPKIMKNV